ncbi:MAG: CRISPR-associated endonuclease Cas2 [Rhodospirillaceae bacterium]|nr:CRISPR-associated endonuclease Cas2 [Rhodospirillaceae bacterium]
MTAARTTYLVCYDIAESPRRLARVRRGLVAVAAPVQYSVFLGQFTPAERAHVLRRLAILIDPRRDDVRLYPVPADPLVEVLGRPVLPPGVFSAAARLQGVTSKGLCQQERGAGCGFRG